MTPANWLIAKAPWDCLPLLFDKEDWLETSNEGTLRLEDEGEELDRTSNGIEDDDGSGLAPTASDWSCMPRWAFLPFSFLALGSIIFDMASSCTQP